MGKPLFYSDYLKANIRDAEICVNGTPIAWNTQVKNNSYYVNYHFATLLEVHPARDGAKANAFGRQSFRYDLTGGQRIYECIIYTNALTYAEKTQIREYLSAKWFDTGANVLPYASSVHIHLDATATNSITWRDIDGKGKCVAKWKSIRGTTLRTASAHQTTNAPLHRIVRDTQPSSRVKAGMPTVDMGPVITTDSSSTGYGTIAAKVGQFMDYTASSSIRSAFLLMGSARGGGCPLGYNGIYDGCNGGNSLVRAMGNEAKTPLSDPATAISVKGKYHCNIDESYLTPLGCAYLNGSRVNANTTGYSGDYDSFAVSAYVNPLKLSAFACVHYNNNFGGLDLCEAILSTKWHSPEEVKLVDAYLRQKWFGETTDGYRPAQIGTLNVASGATVDSIGDAPVTVGALSGAGTVACAVAFAGDAAVFEVEVLADGSVAGPLTVPASLDLSKGGTIRLTGYTSRLKLGRYHLVATTAAPAGDWTLTGYAGRRSVRSETAADGLYLVVKPSGFSILLR